MRRFLLISLFAALCVSAQAQTSLDYRINGRVFDESNCRPPVPVKVQGTSYEFDFVGRQPGRWRVWAVDSKGDEGFKSPWRVFFYLK